ncbi:MAG: Na+/H+ antiporter NhaA [Bacteroidetes bacterium]|nr:Na+/H+ antiporter NhaA [Bacteroidota bacterium]
MRTWARHSLAFLEREKSGGIILLLCTFISLICANTLLSSGYQHFWHSTFFSKPIEFWINDGLMTIFFLQVGLEIEREIYVGELNNFRKSLLPVIAALGGMLVPATIHFIFNKGTIAQSGYGIPMATDIAFSLGILSLLGNRVPLSLKVFLTALAIIDDLGAILVIAVFYSTHFSFLYLGLAFLIFAFLVLLNRMNVISLWIYLLLGCVMWFCMHRSGIHATITGVLLAFAIPFRHGDGKSPSSILQHRLHKPVTFLVLPLFALANTAIALPSTFIADLTSLNSIGIIFGLVLGKPLGIFLFSWIGLTIGWCILPHTLKMRNILALGMLSGIGFTMSIFITLLAFNDLHLIDGSKIAVLVGSMLSGALGLLCLQLTLKKK